jgi:hypothetical protein
VQNKELLFIIYFLLNCHHNSALCGEGGPNREEFVIEKNNGTLLLIRILKASMDNSK